MPTYIVMATESYLGVKHQVLDSSSSSPSGILNQIIPACLSQFCVPLPNSMFSEVLLIA